MSKKLLGVLWSHQETVNLIQVYQQKWYSLNRGQLRASQWEEVAVSVAVRCGYDYEHQTRSATQCRHKIEKLRRRYREEKQRVSVGGACLWPYFGLMESLESGPVPISVKPLALVMNGNPDANIDGYVSDEVGGDGVDVYPKQTSGKEFLKGMKRKEMGDEHLPPVMNRSPNPSVYNYFVDDDGIDEFGVGRNQNTEMGFSRGMKRKEMEEEEFLPVTNRNLNPNSCNYFVDEDGIDEFDVQRKQRSEKEFLSHVRRNEEEEEDGVGFAAEIRGFAEKMMALEKKRMGMVKQTEMQRIEMENKKMKMILDSQKKIVDMIQAAFGA